jgi:hypothetical protein
MDKNQPAAARQAGPLLDEQFIGLEVAATLAYFHVSESSRDAGGDAQLAEVIPLVAIALSTVAPIYMGVDGGAAAVVLTSAEVKDLLFRLQRKGGVHNLRNLVMRREDLTRGMTTLKEARIAFGAARR